MKLKPFALLGLVLMVWGCEKDDICDSTQNTTPRLVLEFFDSNNPTANKNVTQLQVTAVGQSQALGTYTGVSKIKLPLAIGDDQTTYALTLNANNTTFVNTDYIQCHYTRQTLYVSRACGYKMIFALDQVNPLTQTDNTPSDGYWMQQIVVKTNDINNENETHVKVYF